VSGDRLFGLCTMSVHRENIRKDKQGFIERVIGRFGQDLRRLQLLFLSEVDMCC